MGTEARIVRAMPNTPGAIGHGISALYAPRKDQRRETGSSHSLCLLRWAKPMGESRIADRYRDGVSGSGPAYVFLLVEALAEPRWPKASAKRRNDWRARPSLARAHCSMPRQRPAAELRQRCHQPRRHDGSRRCVLLAAPTACP